MFQESSEEHQHSIAFTLFPSSDLISNTLILDLTGQWPPRHGSCGAFTVLVSSNLSGFLCDHCVSLMESVYLLLGLGRSWGLTSVTEMKVLLSEPAGRPPAQGLSLVPSETLNSIFEG